MKVNDLMDKEQMNAAYEAGKRLAKMVSNINLAPKQPAKKGSFSAFVQASLPQQLEETTTDEDLKVLDTALYQLFDWDITSSVHFRGRSNEREANVPVSSIIDTFKKLKAKYDVQITRLTRMGKTVGNIEIIVKDYSNNLNIVLILGKQVVIKTFMQKDPDQFRTGKGQMVFKV